MNEMLDIFSTKVTHLYKKSRSTKSETARILVTVKARPEPSEKYGETVCVAGIRLDTDSLHWVRLYPIPFRRMEDYHQFEKYSVIEAPITPSAEDFRSESYKPDRSQLYKVQEPIRDWKKRMDYILPMVSEMTMCQIRDNCVNGQQQKPYPSLAVIRPYGPLELTIKPYKGWNKKQKQDVQKVLQGDLFEQDNTLEPHQLLQEPRFQGRIKYYCSHECNGHEQMFLDWEFEALARRHNQDTEEVAREAIFKKYHSILDPSKEPLLYVGNQKKYPAAFSVLGIQRTA